LAARVSDCQRCPELANARRQVVVGEAPAGARLALVGEAPGAQEDVAGRPFVGRAGQLLDLLLTDAGLVRDDIAVLNVVKCRPPGNRTPRRGEVDQCRPWLTGQLDVVAPELVVALGLTAVTWFLGRRTSLAGARGTVHRVAVGERTVSVLATYHPSAAIRFGPGGAPMAALREDLALAAKMLGDGETR
jgi:DNA polymerase